MDKTEQLADMVIQAAQIFIEKRLAPMVEAVASMKRELDLRGFLTKDQALEMFAGFDTVRKIEELNEKINVSQPAALTLDQVKAEAAAASLVACSQLLASIPKPADGKSVTMAEVMPEVEKLVAAIPRPKDGKDADPADMAAEVARQIALVPPPVDGKSVDPGALFTEIGAAVQREVATLPKPADGKSVTLDDVRPLIAEAVAAIPAPKDGESVTLDQVRPLIDKGIADAVADIPKPQDGHSPTDDDIRPMIKAMVDAIPRPQDGKSVTLDDLRETIDKGIADAVAAIPVPENGKSITVEDVRPMLAEMVARIPVPQPGKDAIVDYELIDSRIKENIPDPIKGDPGKDADLAVLNDMVTDKVKAAMAEFRPPEKGEPGKDADPVDMEELRRFLTGEVGRELAAWERPKDGADGLGFDDMSMDLKEDGRTMVFRLTRDGREKTFEIVCPWQMYCGVYKAGQRYAKGDQVTYAGSQFTAKRETDKVPGTDDWVLSVKRGKDAA